MYDYEDYYEPNEYEMIINEFKDKMQEVLKGEIKVYYDNIKKDNIELKEQNKKLSGVNYKLINEHKKELESALEEKELEVQRKLGLGFAVNDTVYYIDSKCTTTKCEKCNGEGKVEIEVLGKKTKVNCPHCSYGKVYNYYYLSKEDIVRSLEFWVSREDRYYNNYTGGVLKEDWDIKIWLDKLDNYKRREDLYKTLEECQKNCDEENNK